MSGACDNFILEDQSCEWFELVQYVESFDMGINFLEGPPGPPGPAGEAIFIPSVSEDGWISWTNTAGLPNPDPVYIKGPPGGGGTGDYDDLTDKPSINGVTLSGNKTTAELLISFSAADVGLGNVANERQYSAQNPPPYPVTSVDGMTGAVQLTIPDSTSDLTNDSGFITAAQAAAAAPVQSVNGMTGSVQLTIPDSTSDLTNDSGFITAAQAAAAAPVQSVNGQTGAVVIPTTPTWYYEELSVSGNGDNNYYYTVNGDGWIIATIYVRSDSTNDYGSAIAGVYQTSISDGTEHARGWAGTRTDTASNNEIGAEAVGAFKANSGDTVSLLAKCTKNGTKRIRYSIMCFGCTLTAQ